MGGKSKLLPVLTNKMPEQLNSYFEPFIGGGALMLELNPSNAYISDMNEELIITYKVLRDNPDALINDLYRHKMHEEYYYTIRNLDREIKAFCSLSEIERASRFIYLTKSAFNGLYRVNKKGQHNAPFNKQKSFSFDAKHLRDVSKLLQGVEIAHDDFEAIKSKVKSGDFVYFDPPYLGSNNQYTKDGFGLNEHESLKELCDYLDNIGANFMLSNSCTKETLELFSEYHIDFIDHQQTINPNAHKRGLAREILVRNYQTNKQVNNLVCSVTHTA